MKLINWKAYFRDLCGYECITTFGNDFDIAEQCGGVSAIKDTFNRAFNEWKSDYKFLTELVMVLNHKIFMWYEKNETIARVYDELWRKADEYAMDNLKDKELSYFLQTTD